MVLLEFHGKVRMITLEFDPSPDSKTRMISLPVNSNIGSIGSF